MRCPVNHPRPSSLQGEDIVLTQGLSRCLYKTLLDSSYRTPHKRSNTYARSSKPHSLKTGRFFSLYIFVVFKSLLGKYGPWPWGPLSLVPFDCNCSPWRGTSPVHEHVQEKAWWGFQGNMPWLSGCKSEILAVDFAPFQAFSLVWLLEFIGGLGSLMKGSSQGTVWLLSWCPDGLHFSTQVTP